MIYVKLGRTGLDVSRICLGCMSYGNPAIKNQPWSLGEKESLPFFRQAIELGINFFDTANAYSHSCGLWRDSRTQHGRAPRFGTPRGACAGSL